MNQQPSPTTRISGTVRRIGAPSGRPLPDPAQAWKGGRTLIRLVDITVRKQAATAESGGPSVAAAPTVDEGPSVPLPAANEAAQSGDSARSPVPPSRKAVPADASLQPIVVLALIGLIFGVLAAAIVTGRSNVESAPEVGPPPPWRVAPLESSAGEAVRQTSQSTATEEGWSGEAGQPAAEAPEIALPDPSSSDLTHDAQLERTPTSAQRYPPVARFPGHIEPDTMEARHDRPGTSIH